MWHVFTQCGVVFFQGIDQKNRKRIEWEDVIHSVGTRRWSTMKRELVETLCYLVPPTDSRNPEHADGYEVIGTTIY